MQEYADPDLYLQQRFRLAIAMAAEEFWLLLSSIARKLGLHILGSRSVSEALGQISAALERVDDNAVLPITFEDLLAIEEQIVSYVSAKAQEKGMDVESLGFLTPLAKLYYTEFRGIEPEDLDVVSTDSVLEDEAFEKFLASALGTKLRAKQLRTYLSYAIELVDKVES